MKSKSFHGNRLISFLSGVFLLASSLPSVALTRDDPAGQPASVASPTGSSGDVRAASPLWRTYIWDAFPVEWLGEANQSIIPEAYQQNDWRPFFISSDFQLTPGAKVLIERLGMLESDGIDAKPYELPALRKGIQNIERLCLSLKSIDPRYRDTLAEPQGSTPPATTAPQAQVNPSAKNQYAMNSPQIRPPDSVKESKQKEALFREVFRASSEIDIKLAHSLVLFAQEMNPFSKQRQMDALLGRIPVQELLRELEPPAYDALRREYHRYLQLDAKFPRPERIAEGPTIRQGETGNRVRCMQTRLQQEGHYTGKITGVYDAATAEAVKEFQRSHVLEADGVAGAQTTQWLNVPYQKKAQMAAVSMQLMRQSETRRYDGGRFVRINIPQFVLEYHKDGKVEDVHRIIVGKASGKKIKLRGRWIGENQTPPLSSFIEQVVINPRWYVSDRIRRELNDEIAADPNYLSRLGYVKMSSQYPWGEPRIFQLPGPNNPLGQVKFEFPNAYAVFLHDTPKKQLFRKARRDFSHGCMRMEGAQQFAELLLAEDESTYATKTQAYLQSGRQAFIKLQHPVPIIIEYLPVSVNEKGQIVFCGDPYNWFGGDASSKS